MLPPTTVQGFPKISMITKSPQKKSKSVEKLNRATTPIPPSTSPFPYQSLWNLHIRPFASSADTSKGKKKSSKWQAGSWCRRFRLKSPFFLIHRISTCVACRWWTYHLNCPTTLQKLYIGIASKRLRNVNLMDHKHPAVPNSSNTSHYFAKGADFLQPQGAALQLQQGLRYQGDSYRILMCLDNILVGRYQSSCRCFLGQS